MVRSLVGNLLMVGVGAWPAGQIGAVLAAHNRAAAAAPAPACGLCLLQVDYE
jgi:tRNA pseudouridine38-40 synthase